MIKILIAEDQSMVLGALSALLDLEDDLEVVAKAENGKKALEAAKENDVDIILTDIEMPEMTGIELLNKVNELRLKTKIGLITAEKNEESILQAKKAGAMFIVNKPFTVDKLKESLIPALAGVSPIQDPPIVVTQELLFPSPSAMSMLLSTITSTQIKVEKVAPVPVQNFTLPSTLALYGASDKDIKAVQILDADICDRGICLKRI